MPTDWLKLLAFAFGAAVAALTGSLFASLKVGVFPESFSLTLLITVYAMLILGGVGSQTGAVLGAVVVYVFLEALRDPDVSGWVFYIAIVARARARRPPALDGRRRARRDRRRSASSSMRSRARSTSRGRRLLPPRRTR